MRSTRTIGATMIVLLPVAIAASSATHVAGSHLAQFLSAAEAPLNSYTARRFMLARNVRFEKEAWLEAITQLDPNLGFTYDVMSSSGSSTVINRALVTALEGEAAMWRAGAPRRAALTPDNYDFAPLPSAAEGAEEVGISVRPKRKHVLLVDGSMFLSARDADLLRVEGRLSKNPSLWVSRVEVVRRYARLNGVRVPVELHSVAHVRFAGRSEMWISYIYESINGAAVEDDQSAPAWLPNVDEGR